MLVAGELSGARKGPVAGRDQSKEATKNQEQPLAWAQGPERETLPKGRKDDGRGPSPDPA